MGLPENWNELCFGTVKKEDAYTEIIDSDQLAADGNPYDYHIDSTITVSRSSIAKADLDETNDQCVTVPVEKRYNITRNEVQTGIGNSYGSTIIDSESAVQIGAGDCVGTYETYVYAVLPSGTTGPETITGDSFNCGDADSLTITPDMLYSYDPGKKEHVFRKPYVYGDITVTGQVTGEIIITLTENGSFIYQVCIPDGYAALNRSTYQVQWDIAFLEGAWKSWYLGGQIGPEPPHKPVFAEQRFWAWDPTEPETCSRRYKFPEVDCNVLPCEDENGAIMWTAEIINILVVCWRSARYGFKPTAHGIQYEWAEGEGA